MRSSFGFHSICTAILVGRNLRQISFLHGMILVALLDQLSEDWFRYVIHFYCLFIAFLGSNWSPQSRYYNNACHIVRIVICLLWRRTKQNCQRCFDDSTWLHYFRTLQSHRWNNLCRFGLTRSIGWQSKSDYYLLIFFCNLILGNEHCDWFGWCIRICWLCNWSTLCTIGSKQFRLDLRLLLVHSYGKNSVWKLY